MRVVTSRRRTSFSWRSLTTSVRVECRRSCRRTTRTAGAFARPRSVEAPGWPGVRQSFDHASAKPSRVVSRVPRVEVAQPCTQLLVVALVALRPGIADGAALAGALDDAGAVDTPAQSAPSVKTMFAPALEARTSWGVDLSALAS